MSLGRILHSLQSVGDLNIVNMDADNTEDTYHSLKHKFRESLIIPYLGISHNIQLFTKKGEHFVTTSDNVKCKVKSWKEIHMCEMEKDVQELYHIDTWSFVNRWYKYERGMDSMYFIKMELEKIEENGE